MNWFKKIKERRNHKNNLKVSENIGMITVDALANNRNFRRVIETKFPNMAKRIDVELKKIRN